MEPQVRLVVLALMALLGCSLGCDFTERESSDRAPLMAMLISRMQLQKNLTPEQCKEQCCRSSGCDTAVHELRDGAAQCHLFECHSQCKYVEVTDAKYRVFTRTDAPANPPPHIAPLQLGPSSLPTNNEKTDPENKEKSGKNSGVCALPAEVGPCRAAFRRFFFNPASGACEQFVYGGCRGNSNNFETQGECEQNCNGGDKGENKDETKGVCALPAKVGPCRGAFSRFFFNPASGACEQFVYGGCRGNSNNFETQGECEQNCSGGDKGVCALPAKVGPCRAAFPRFFFNPASGACEQFFYGGCRGNSNNFETQGECEQNCSGGDKGVCALPAKVGPCRGAFPRFFFNPASGACEQFFYGGCRGNSNNFKTQGECEQNCSGGDKGVCALPAKVGPCRGAFPRFFFNPASGACEQFVYGNSNNFETQGECEQNCNGGDKGSDGGEAPSEGKTLRLEALPQTEMDTDEYKELCLSPLVVGPCRAAFRRWFFNQTSGLCQRFIYGGCKGNKNNHESEDDCKSACSAVKVLPSKKIVPQETVPQETVPQETVPQETVPQETVPQKSDEDKAHCEVAPEVGPCRAAFSMFYFDSESQSCKSFIYGGCGGNDNRYKSEAECVERCTDTGAFEGRGRARHRWSAAFFLFLSLAAVSFLLLTALIFITIKRHRIPRPRPALSIRSDKEELLPDSERSSVDSLPLPESPTRS